jgi:hypothetical protein
VGSYDTGSGSATLIERNSGDGWTMIPSPSRGESTLASIACPSVSACWSVGYSGSGGAAQTLIERLS